MGPVVVTVDRRLPKKMNPYNINVSAVVEPPSYMFCCDLTQSLIQEEMNILLTPPLHYRSEIGSTMAYICFEKRKCLFNWVAVG